MTSSTNAPFGGRRVPSSTRPSGPFCHEMANPVPYVLPPAGLPFVSFQCCEMNPCEAMGVMFRRTDPQPTGLQDVQERRFLFRTRRPILDLEQATPPTSYSDRPRT